MMYVCVKMHLKCKCTHTNKCNTHKTTCFSTVLVCIVTKQWQYCEAQRYYTSKSIEYKSVEFAYELVSGVLFL